MRRYALVLLALAVGSVSSSQPISARLDLVAVNQTTTPLIFEGAFDVYHVVADRSIGDATLIALDLADINLVASDFGDRDAVRIGPSLDRFSELSVPYSFAVAGQIDPNLRFVFDSEATESSLRVTYGAFASPLFPPLLVDDVPRAEQTVAVLTVPAGSGKPEITGQIGFAFTPNLFGPVGPDDPPPGDSNGDLTVDLLDLDVSAPIFPQPPRREWPDSLDFNGDGMGNEADVAILAANFGSTRIPDPETSQVFVLDVATAEIVIDPTFFPVPLHPTLLDLDILGANFGVTPATVSQGDYNGDRIVDLLDLDILGSAFGSNPASVPEPSAGALFLLVTAGWNLVARSR